MTIQHSYSGGDLKNIARCQSGLCWLVLVRMTMIAVFISLNAWKPAAAAAFRSADPAVTVMLVVLSLLFAFFLAKLLRKKFPILYAVGMILPLVNLLTLLYLVIQATRALRENGIRVGIMGAKSEDLKKIPV